MAQILAGQIIRAVDLNYPQTLTANISGGPTSGTTELLLATLTVPAQPIDTVQLPVALFHAIPDANGADDRWLARIRDDTITGFERSQAFDDRIGGANSTQVRFKFPLNVPNPRIVPANTEVDYLVTVQRSAGDGILSSIVVGRITVDVRADRS